MIEEELPAWSLPADAVAQIATRWPERVTREWAWGEASGAGVRVCIVDCDLRRPCLADAFRVDPAIGFTSVLLGTTSLESALGVSESWGPHLTILPAGPVPPNPSELLSSPRVHKLFEVLAQMFDDHANFMDDSASLTNFQKLSSMSNFGAIRQAADPRIGQLALKLFF